MQGKVDDDSYSYNYDTSNHCNGSVHELDEPCV